jgi:fibronectin type 3 domain-containing protein
VQLTWQGTGEDIVVYYQIYRRVAGTEDWQPLAQVPSQGDNRGNYQYLDTGAQKGETYEYEVTAIDQYSHESQPSNVASIKIV